MSSFRISIIFFFIICNGMAHGGGNGRTVVIPTTTTTPTTTTPLTPTTPTTPPSTTHTTITLPLTTPKTFKHLYDEAITAYHNQDFQPCFHLFQASLSEHHLFKNTSKLCAFQCQQPSLLSADESNFLEHSMVDLITKQYACLRECHKQRLPAYHHHPVTTDVELRFENFEPYDFIQLCAFKLDKFEDSFKAAYTFAQNRPNHHYAQRNVLYYQSQPVFKPEWLKDLEEKPYQAAREKGLEAHAEEEWAGLISHMEEALKEYYQEHEYCAIECQTAYYEERFKTCLQKANKNNNKDEDKNKNNGDEEGDDKTKDAKDEEMKDQVKICLAEYWSIALSCTQACSGKLCIQRGYLVDRYYLDHFHYLQYAYYHTDQLHKAAASVASLLLHLPNNNDHLFNKLYYLENSGGDLKESDFLPRMDAMKFYESIKRVQGMKKVCDEQLIRINKAKTLKTYTHMSEEIYLPKDPAFLLSFAKFFQSIGMSVAMDTEKLGGGRRVVMDGLVSSKDAKKLLQLANLGERDKLKYVTVTKAAEFAREGKASEESVWLLMEVAERMKRGYERYLNLDVPLMFQKTALYCRSWEKDHVLPNNRKTEEVVDSECGLGDNGLCFGKERRDFMSVMYLDNSQDGLFYFKNDKAHQETNTKLEIPSLQGRSVSTHITDPHAFENLKKGRKCFFSLFFTLSPPHQDLDNAHARNILRNISRANEDKTGNFSIETAKYLKKNLFSVSYNEEDLMSEERYGVDGLATEQECQNLMRITNMAGYSGDGYIRNLYHSPHTVNERFGGLNLEDAAKLASEHKISPEDVELFLDMSIRLRDVVLMTMLGPNKQLYFSFTHLVCRSAMNDANLDRSDLSHPIHADNCIMQEDKSCKRISPAYTERDFSVLLYLNDNFLGGDFFFAHQNMTVQSSVKPKCGRMVAFNSGHYHGVKPVLSGQRCALAIWFTLDESFNEASHENARRVVRDVRSNAYGSYDTSEKIEL